MRRDDFAPAHTSRPPASNDDADLLLGLRDLIASLDAAGAPTLRLVAPASPGADSPFLSARRVGFLAGSFNPIHNGHVALAEAALATGKLDAIVLTLSKRTVDKERVIGLALEDRLAILAELCTSRPSHYVALVNRGLYVDQACIFHEACPALEELEIVLGYDKLVQIFDARYYADRDQALDQLFSLASVLVAPRSGVDSSDIAALLAATANRRYRDRVRVLPFAPALADVSSTRLREAALAGDRPAAGLPAEASRYLDATGAFAPPVALPSGESIDRYALRIQVLAALDHARPAIGAGAPLAALVRLSTAPGEPGRRFRVWLAQDADLHKSGSAHPTDAQLAGDLFAFAALAPTAEP